MQFEPYFLNQIALQVKTQRIFLSVNRFPSWLDWLIMRLCKFSWMCQWLCLFTILVPTGGAQPPLHNHPWGGADIHCPLASKQNQYPNLSQTHPEFPSGLPSKCYPGPMLLNYSIIIGTCVSNMAGRCLFMIQATRRGFWVWKQFWLFRCLLCFHFLLST